MVQYQHDDFQVARINRSADLPSFLSCVGALILTAGVLGLLCITRFRVSENNGLTLSSASTLPLPTFRSCLSGGTRSFRDGHCICPYRRFGERCQKSFCPRVDQRADLGMPFHGGEGKEPAKGFPWLNLSICETDPQVMACHTRKLDPLPTLPDEETWKIDDMLQHFAPWDRNDILMLDYWSEAQQSLAQVRRNSRLFPEASGCSQRNAAFVILVRNKDIHLLSDLLEFIYRPHHLYVIHLERRHHQASSAILHNLAARLLISSEASNIIIINQSRSFETHWGGVSLVYGQLASTIAALEFAHAQGDFCWSHVINLSASDFPIKPLSALEKFLSLNHGTSFLESYHDGGRDLRHQRVIVPCGESVYSMVYNSSTGFSHLPNPFWISNLQAFFGSQWSILSREFAIFLVSNFTVLNILFAFRNTFVPDEHFIATVAQLYSGPHRLAIRNNYRHINWSSPGLLVTQADIPRLATSAAFFARKMSDSSVVASIKSWLTSNATPPLPS